MILKTDGMDRYGVIGSSFVVRFEDTQHLLGPLPDSVTQCAQRIGAERPYVLTIIRRINGSTIPSYQLLTTRSFCIMSWSIHHHIRYHSIT